MQRSILAGIMVLGLAGPSQGAVVDLLSADPLLDIYLGKFPSGLQDQKIFLQSGTGTTVTGNVGAQNGSTIVDFASSASLKAVNGFAQISGGANFHDLTISVTGNAFDNLIFSSQARDLTITAFHGSTSLGTLTLTGLGTGVKNFLVDASGGATITSILLQSTSGFLQTKQFQIAGLQPWTDTPTLVSHSDPIEPPAHMPGPTAGAGLPGLIAAVGALVALVRRRKLVA
jgi:hypothetical protein